MPNCAEEDGAFGVQSSERRTASEALRPQRRGRSTELTALSIPKGFPIRDLSRMRGSN